MKQLGDEWFAEKLCKITGRRAASIMGTDKAKKTLMAEMIREKVMANQKKIFMTDDMRRGVEDEPKARAYYELINNVTVAEIGLVYSDVNGMFAVSPDGLIGYDGGLEIKCKKEENHILDIVYDTIEKQYIYQMQWALYVTKRKWWDYFGYCDTLSEPLKSYQKRIFRDEKMISEMESNALEFAKEFDCICDKMGLSL